MLDLIGRKALVTGATKGIGLAIAEALAAAGASVVVSARTITGVTATVDRLAKSSKGKISGVAADLSDHAECDRLIIESQAALGGLDILINNAGVGIIKSMTELSWTEWRAQLDLNLGAVWACSKAALPHLERSGDAWIINIGSLAGRNPFAGGTGYNASKFGLVGMSEAMMLDLRALGIRVSMVMPGSVNTGFGGKEKQERGWKLEAEDCALAVMQLLSFPKGALVSRIEMRPAVTK